MGMGNGKLRQNPANPRRITEQKLKQLEKSMREFGDISGIVFNTRTGNLVGGNQRSKELDETSKVVLTKKYDKPTRTGTTAIGYVLHHGERFAYREVDWDIDRETAAMIAANNNAGVWDRDILSGHMKRLASFDSGLDLELTMFDEDEREQFNTEPVSEVSSSNPATSENSDPSSPSKLIHECPRCGYEFR